MRQTKIIATVGPASIDMRILGGLVDAGADVLRINCSHVTTAVLVERIDLIRAVRPQAAILVDIQGPKLRYAGEAQT
ncbi:MAG: pyruvate kinase, partial [Actinomycetota bacterium]